MTTFRRPVDLHVEVFDDGVVAYLPPHRSLHLLDPLAASLWTQLADDSVDDVARMAAASHPERGDDVQHDVRRLAEQLADVGLLLRM